MPILRNSSPLQDQALSLGKKSVPFLFVAIHFSSSATLVMSILFALLWLVSAQVKNIGIVVEQTPVTLYALLLMIWLALSVSYSSAPYPQAFATLSKYRELLLLPILIPFLDSEPLRTRCENFLLATLLATLLISFAGYLDLISSGLAKYLLKNRITHSLFMAFLGFYCLHRLYDKDRYTPIWAIVLILVGLNLFVASDGRTGQLVFLLLCMLFFLQIFGIRTASLLILAILVAFALFLFFSPHSGRYLEGINESIAFYNQSENLEHTSMGDRLRFWSNALGIIAQSPFFGEGVGGFPYKFQQLFPNYPVLSNPHNEYLLIASQLGLPGLVLFLAFLASILRQAARLPQTPRWLLQGIWLTISSSCLFNSSILDHTEGHWFLALLALYSAPLVIYPTCLAASSKTQPNTLAVA